MADTKVKLDLASGDVPDPPDGWTTCKDGAKNPIAFRYKYTGGNVADDGEWKFDKHTGGDDPKHIHIQLTVKAKQGDFEIEDVIIKYDDPQPVHKDLKVFGNGPHNRSIHNANVHAQGGDFTVVVSHAAVTDIHCDPKWRNN